MKIKKERQHNAAFSLIRVRKAPGSKKRGLLLVDGRSIPCALGRSGIGIGKREGDGKTPLGRFVLISAMLRTERTACRAMRLDWRSIKSTDGWCDEAGHSRYNRPIELPFPASHETLKRRDHLYDIIVVMDHNITRHLGVGGSAIFFHLAHEDYCPTEGCVAIARRDMDWLLPRIGPNTVMVVE